MNVRNCIAALVACLGMVACGGGGGGDSSGGGGGGSGRNSISASVSSLDFRSFENASPNDQDVTVTFRGDGVVVGYPPGQSVPSWLSVSAPATASSPVNVRFHVFAGIGPGSYSATVRLLTGNVSGSDLAWTDVVVRFRVDSRFGATAPNLNFEQVDGGLNGSTPGAGHNVNLTGSNSSWTATASAPWISVTPSSGANQGTAVVQVSRQGMAKGTHTGEVVFRDSVAGFSYSFPVRYVIRDTRLVSSSNSLAWTITPTTTSGDLSATLQLSDEIGGAAPGYNLRWTAAVDQPWLQLSSSHGTTGTPASITVTANALLLANSRPGSNVANIALNFVNDSGASGTLTIPATAQMRLPLARAVTPYRLDPGVARTVVLRGEDMADEDLPRLRLDGAPVSASRVDYTTWNVQLPALAAGEHQLTFTNTLGVTRSFAWFQARAAVVPPAGFIANADEKSRVLYDEQRGRIYVLNRTAERVHRYRWNGSAWTSMTGVPVAQAQDIDFDRTGRELYVLADSAIHRVDLDMDTPVAFPWMPSVGRELLPANPDFGYIGLLDSGVAMVAQQFPGSGGSETLVVDLLRGDQPLNQFGAPVSVARPYEGRLNVSGDGRFAAIGECCLSPGGELFLVDGRAGTGRDLAYQTYRIDVSRSNYRYMSFDASNRWLLGDYSLFDISNPPPVFPTSNPVPVTGTTLPDTTLYSVLSPDGRRVYALLVYGNATNRVAVYDTQAVVDGKLTKLGEVPLAANVAEPTDDFHHYARTAHKFSGLITRDGQRLIFSGTRGIIVMEVPAL